MPACTKKLQHNCLQHVFNNLLVGNQNPGRVVPALARLVAPDGGCGAGACLRDGWRRPTARPLFGGRDPPEPLLCICWQSSPGHRSGDRRAGWGNFFILIFYSSFSNMFITSTIIKLLDQKGTLFIHSSFH